MVKSSAMRTFIVTLFALSALLIACGPSANLAEAPPVAQQDPDAIPFVGESAAGSTNERPTALSDEAGGSAAAVDGMGITVGFTDEGRPYRGDLNAPVVMEEFSDFQCPYCSRFTSDTMPSLLQNQIAAGQVVLVFHDFPLTTIHPQAAAAANAARCAGEAGAAAYWAMHDRLFVDPAEWSNNGANDVFLRYAQELGVAQEGFASCLEENRHGDAVDEDVALGRSRGVSSTPSFFLNDQPVIGAYPLDYFNQAIAAVSAGQTVAAEPEAPQGPAVRPTPATLVMDDFAGERGDPNAPVTIIEFTDLQCPYCVRHATETLPLIITELIDTGRVHYVVKDFPLDAIHPEARRAAVAARCAAEQDAYWEMHDELFARQPEWSGQGEGATAVFAALAADLSLDADAFAACLDSGRHDAVIQTNQDEGVALGVQGTPAFFINGFPVSGAQPFELFEYAVGLAEEGTLADAYVAPSGEAQAEPTPAGPVEVDTEGAYSVGNDDAPVVIVEFTDYQCPFCSRHFLQTYPQIKAEYVDTGKVRYVFMDFPLSSIHPQAQMAAEAARCVGEQGAYLTMHDMLFARQQEWGGRDDAAQIFSGYVAELELDTAAFDDCLQSGRQESAVLADLERGVALGINGTPGFFINGHFLSGAQPYDVFQQAIESMLAEAG
ncbi:MAG: thioredoxin domain-containing protein [Candidatus Promineofilum sp.]|nr:thioredoxin domain-containing protein [Promineifilum sp.]